MSASKTFLQMRTRARQLADMENSNFVSETELKDIVNEQCADLYDILIEARGEEYFRKDAPPFQTVIGVRQYNLPVDYYRLTNVAADNGSVVHGLSRFEENEIPQLMSMEKGGGAWDVFSTRYAPIGGKLELRPTPKEAFDVHVFYIPAFQGLVNDTDTFDGINGWEVWVELSSAIVMLNKEESDASMLMAERARVEQRIRRLAPNRDQARPPRIVDTRQDWYVPLYDDWNL